MNQNSTGGERSVAFLESDRVNIASLDPEITTSSQSYIEATVALIWPFSSSSRLLSLLLAEKDVRLRAKQGQVKVTFRGQCAEEIARTQISIGATVKLRLGEASWQETGVEVSTPGQKLAYDLEYRGGVGLEITYGDRSPRILQVVVTAVSPARQPVTAISDNGPHTNGHISIVPEQYSASYPSDTRRTPQRPPASTFIDASLDPFAEDDGYILGRGRKRTKYARLSGSWKLLDELETPTQTAMSPSRPDTSTEVSRVGVAETSLQARKVSIDLHTPAAESHQTDKIRTTENTSLLSEDNSRDIDTSLDLQENIAGIPIIPMAPPAPSSLDLNRTVQRPESTNPPALDHAPPLSIPTPMIQPVASPGLAFVSPFIHQSGSDVEYFPVTSNQTTNFDVGDNDLDVARSAESEYRNPTAPPAVDVGPSSLVADDASIKRGGSVSATQVLHLPHSSPDASMTMMNITDVHPAGSEPNLLHFESVNGGFIDLDFLQQQINNDIIGVDEGPSDIPVIEDDDLYGSPAKERTMEEKVVSNTYERQTQSSEESVIEALSFNPEAPDKVTQEDIREGGTGIEQSNPNFMNDVQQLDGTSDIYEDEATRMRLRRRLSTTLPNTQSTDVIETLSNLSQTSPISRIQPESSLPIPMTSTMGTDLVGLFPQTMEKSPGLAIMDVSASEQDVIPQVSIDQDLIVDQVTNAPISLPASDFAEVTIATPVQQAHERSIGGRSDLIQEEAHVSHEPSAIEENLPYQIMTPATTQQSVTERKPVENPDVNKNLIFPPTPVLTQQHEQRIEISSPVTHELHQHLSETNKYEQEVSPVDTSIKAVSKSRRFSQRLTRNIFASEPVVSNYFTPRKHGRVEQSTSPDNVVSQRSEQNVSHAAQETASSMASSLRESVYTARHHQSYEAMSSPYHSITTSLSYFPTLALLAEHHGQLVDVIAICTAPSSPAQRARSGPKDYHTTLHLTDPSLPENITRAVQIFRPQKTALPVVRRGDVVLVRDMKVQSMNHEPMLLSSESSAWTVFQADQGSLLTSASGPPVEHGEAEESYCKHLLHWWDAEKDHFPDVVVDNVTDRQDKELLNSSSVMTRSQKRKTNMMDQFRNSIDTNLANTDQRSDGIDLEVQDELTPLPKSATQRAESELSSPSLSTRGARVRPRTRRRSRRSESMVHELRDGTKYVDNDENEGSLVHELRDGLTYIDD